MTHFHPPIPPHNLHGFSLEPRVKIKIVAPNARPAAATTFPVTASSAKDETDMVKTLRSGCSTFLVYCLEICRRQWNRILWHANNFTSCFVRLTSKASAQCAVAVFGRWPLAFKYDKRAMI